MTERSSELLVIRVTIAIILAPKSRVLDGLIDDEGEAVVVKIGVNDRYLVS